MQPIPTHVPAQLVIDFDFSHPPGTEQDVYAAWARLHDGPPLVYSPHHGGHWIATRANLIEAIQKDHEHFSHEEFTLPRRGNSRPRAAPLEYDPPQHTAYRKILNPPLSPRAIAALEQKIRGLTVQLIESFRASGHCEFVGDFAHRLPIVVFLDLMQLPQSERERFLEWGDLMVRSTDEHAKMQVFMDVGAYLQRWIDEREANPGDDLISHVTQAQVDGRPLTSQEKLSMCLLLFAGGLDTVATMMSFIALALARDASLRSTLAAEPKLIAKAIEEFLRRHGLSNTTRLVTKDYEFAGVHLKKGDIVMVPIALHGLDAARWSDPWKVDLDRDTRGHATFGNGPHRCVGATLARLELKLFLEEWLTRIPDFELTPGESPQFVSGAVIGVKSLSLAWSPQSSDSFPAVNTQP